MIIMQDRYGNHYNLSTTLDMSHFNGEIFVECESDSCGIYRDDSCITRVKNASEVTSILRDRGLDHLPVTFIQYDDTRDDQVYCAQCGTAPCSI